MYGNGKSCKMKMSNAARVVGIQGELLKYDRGGILNMMYMIRTSLFGNYIC